MIDPVSEIISLLCPRAPYSKLAHATGPFQVRREDVNEVFYCMLLTGRVCLKVDGKSALTLTQGDFVLIPAVNTFTISSLDPPPPPDLLSQPVLGDDGIFRVGSPKVAAPGSAQEPAEVQQLVGHCSFASPDADLLVALLPDMVVVRGEERLSTLATLVRDEARENRPARDAVVEHLLQVLLIEAFRSTTQTHTSSGLLRGLADSRIAPALRALHARPAHAWTAHELAEVATLSRSAFYTRFNRVVGISPMGYLLNWRMTLARHMLRSGRHTVSEVSRRIGYGSVSAFSTAFSRHTGCAPASYAQVEADLPSITPQTRQPQIVMSGPSS